MEEEKKEQQKKVHKPFLRLIKYVINYYYMAWLNSNVECGLLFLDNRPLRSITDRCHEKQHVAMDAERTTFFGGSNTIVFKTINSFLNQ